MNTAAQHRGQHRESRWRQQRLASSDGTTKQARQKQHPCLEGDANPHKVPHAAGHCTPGFSLAGTAAGLMRRHYRLWAALPLPVPLYRWRVLRWPRPPPTSRVRGTL